MSGGAVVAAAAAAHARRLQALTDAFRLGDATAPERARPLAQLGVVRGREFDELARAGVLLPGAYPDSWYLSESAVIARRDAHRRTTRTALLVVMLLLALAAVLAGVLLATRSPAR